jgi:uncharacterized protein YqeY
MKLIEKISIDFMEAYKAKEMAKKDFLGVLKTEVTKESKEPDDVTVVNKIKSMIKNAEATNSLSRFELEILNRYLPVQMSDETLRHRIVNYIEVSKLEGANEMGKVMAFLKSNFDGQYDGKRASEITRELLK